MEVSWMRSLLFVGVLAVLLLAASIPAAAEDPAWRDDFDDGAKIASSSGVVVAGGEVRLEGAPSEERAGAVLRVGDAGSWDSWAVAPFAVLREPTGWRMWHSGCNDWPCKVGYAESQDGFTWVKRGPVVEGSLPQEGGRLSYGDVVKAGDTYWMWYSAWDGITWRIFAATSPDGLSWTKHGVVLDAGKGGAPDSDSVFRPSVVYSDGVFRMWYTGRTNGGPGGWTIQAATSPDGLAWAKEGVVIRPGDSNYSSYRAWAPAVRLVGDRYEMVYTGHDGANERLLLADSPDGRDWRLLGVLVDLGGPGEDYLLNQAAFLFGPDGRRYVYYAARGSSYNVFLTVLGDAAAVGWLQSIPIVLPEGGTWSSVRQVSSAPEGTSVRLRVVDPATGLVVPGFESGLSRPTFGLSGLAPDEYPELVIEARLQSSVAATPALDALEVSWWPPPRSGCSVGTAAAAAALGFVVALVVISAAWLRERRAT